MKTCIDCGKNISPRATRCRECNKSSPVAKQKHMEVVRDPAHRKKLSESIRKAHEKRIKKEQLAVDISYDKYDPVDRKRGKYIVENRGIYNTSKLETKIIQIINNLGIKCKQSYMPREINYIFDGYISKSKTLIEVDGKYWHGSELNKKNGVKASESKKTALAHAAGYNLIRFKEEKLPKQDEKLVSFVRKILLKNNILES